MAAIAAFLFGGLLAAALVAPGTSPGQGASQRSDDRIPGRYIVVYRDSVDLVNRATERRERSLGFSSRFRYRSALNGFCGAAIELAG